MVDENPNLYTLQFLFSHGVRLSSFLAVRLRLDRDVPVVQIVSTRGGGGGGALGYLGGGGAYVRYQN